ncbi:MAG: transposase [Ruminococcus sp.]|nr:transposase [Ruminococcus sp.]
MPCHQFPSNEIKMLYAMRWGIETSFRDLKYTVGLLHFHAKKTESILQEIWSRLIMYYFSQFVASHSTIKNCKRKHLYRINLSQAVHICRNFLLRRIPPSNVEVLIAAHILPIRPGGSNPRAPSRKHAAYFIYRVA